MPKRIPILLLILAVLLAACQGAAQSQPSPTSLQVEPSATQAIKPTSAATLAVAGTPGDASSAYSPTVAPTAAQTEASAVTTPAGTAAPAKCTVVSQSSEPTAESPFAPVSESDWIKGPADAKITIIEYSDFI